MIVKKITIKTGAWLIIAVLAMLLTNQVVFEHSHQLADGTIISHAHPYDKSGDQEPHKQHTHTIAALIFFENLEILFPLVFLFIAGIGFVKRDKYVTGAFKQPSLVPIYSLKGRSPPLS